MAVNIFKKFYSANFYAFGCGVFDYSSRMSIETFIYTALGSALMSFILHTFASYLSMGDSNIYTMDNDIDDSREYIFLLSYTYIALVSVANATRRLHDINKTFFHLFVVIIPILGYWLLIYWLFFKTSYEKANIYGPNPLGGDKAISEYKQFMQEYDKSYKKRASAFKLNLDYMTKDDKDFKSKQ